MTTPLHAGLRRMRPRDPNEPNRSASTLELFFDLTFVVAVSVAAQQLLTAEEHGVLIGILRFLLIFFAIWWAWVNFTWFASAFDTDDWLYRILTIVLMGGVLVLAAGIPALATRGDFTVPIIGYVVMRLAMVAQWLRASRSPQYRATSLRYAAGVAAVQLGWVLSLVVPSAMQAVGALVLVVLELLVPAWAERPRITPFHRHHIAERYGLFTLIVIGEDLLTVTTAMLHAQASAHAAELVLLGGTSLVMIAGMWWIYFARRAPVIDADMRGTFAFGYQHYLVFGGAAAVASGIEVGIQALGTGEESTLARLATTLPLAIYLVATWAVILRPALGRTANVAVPALGVAAGAAALLPFALQVTTAAVVAIVVVLEVDASRTGAASAD